MSLEKNNRNNSPIIELFELTKSFGDKLILNNLNWSINKGEFITLLGPSGSGKTTILRLIGGFEQPTRGEIKFFGRDVKDLPPYKRPTKTIFQDYALFPHLSVEKNVMYGLKLLMVPKDNLSDFGQKKEKQLKELVVKWEKQAQVKFQKLDNEQEEYEETMKQETKTSKKHKKAQKWLDSSDFNYSYWENYVQLKTIRFTNRYLSRKLTKEEMSKRVNEVISLVGLEGNEKRQISELSGGMKQRIALARALVCKPEVLLLDEPLSALDLKVRQQMQVELKQIHKTLGTTFIFVTHDQEEAISLSDRIMVLKDGKIEQSGTPQEIYDYPQNKWVANFIGESNIFEGQVVSKGKVKFLGNQFSAATFDIKNKEKVDIMLRPEDIELSLTKKTLIKGQVESHIYRGLMWEQVVNVDGKKITVQSTKKVENGKEVYLTWDNDDIHVMSQGKNNE